MIPRLLVSNYFSDFLILLRVKSLFKQEIEIGRFLGSAGGLNGAE